MSMVTPVLQNKELKMQNTVRQTALNALSARTDVVAINTDPVTGAILFWVDTGNGRYAPAVVLKNGGFASFVLLPGDFLSFVYLTEVPVGTLLVTVTKTEIAQATVDIFANLNVYFPMGGWA
jgi:hypothetical protein